MRIHLQHDHKHISRRTGKESGKDANTKTKTQERRDRDKNLTNPQSNK